MKIWIFCSLLFMYIYADCRQKHCIFPYSFLICVTSCIHHTRWAFNIYFNFYCRFIDVETVLLYTVYTIHRYVFFFPCVCVILKTFVGILFCAYTPIQTHAQIHRCILVNEWIVAPYFYFMLYGIRYRKSNKIIVC